jgi:hypothetical protein
VVCLENPKGIFRLGDELAVPLDLQVLADPLEEGRAREGAWVQRNFGWHLLILL